MLSHLLDHKVHPEPLKILILITHPRPTKSEFHSERSLGISIFKTGLPEGPDVRKVRDTVMQAELPWVG